MVPANFMFYTLWFLNPFRYRSLFILDEGLNYDVIRLDFILFKILQELFSEPYYYSWNKTFWLYCISKIFQLRLNIHISTGLYPFMFWTEMKYF